MKQDVRQLMKESENLARLGVAVVDVDEGKFAVVEAESRITLPPKSILENEDANRLQGAAPRFQRNFVAAQRN